MTTRSGACSSIWRQDVLHVRFAVYVALVVADAEPFRPHLDLLGRFLARNVQRFQAVCAQRDLQAQRRFADARLAAQQDHRAPDQSPAEHPVHLGAGEVEPPLLALLYFPDALGFRPGPVACQSGYGRGVLAGDHFLREGVPCSARRAVPSHFGASNPHSLQKYAFLILAMSFQLSVKDSYSRGIVPPKAKFFLSPVRFRAVAWRLVRGGPTDRLPVRAPDCTRSVSEAGCVRYPGMRPARIVRKPYVSPRAALRFAVGHARKTRESPAPGYLMKNR